ncbi:protein-methionine sulfoxide oxidase mical3a isoform X6 [Denticeps clupeoides]|uniref:protein-methionine sulfoxide oxidase mical3a isoform X6 n=1 Tax=Denticeps clupeoides TaxID=299321 RepID=UPI0010A3B513|nr:F-actin-monooxygenase MICAL3 isoform X6 [Denticeps clupeoides]
MGDGGGGGVGGEHSNQSHVLFDRFVGATTCKGTLKAFQELCDFLELRPTDTRIFYHKLKSRLNYWKAKALWAKLDKRASHKDYKKGRACANTKCLIIGAGPCGLRTAIELGLLGAKVVLLEKRDAFSRNNVLHLWPFTIQDLRGLGAKKFYGKFCAGAIDHISIRQLQLMLLKMALLLGVEIHVNVEFKGLIEPPEDQENERIGWRAEVHPRTHPVNELEFDVIIGADGRRNTLSGFRRKEFRGKLAIAITANFINRNTTAEAKVEEISGVAFIFNQKFFQDLREATGIDLENIVYYKDDTHYFVMTAKKQSLLDKGVILHDYTDTEMLLSRSNVDQMALLSYAREAADFSTNHQLPTLDFAINHYGQPDVAMFDFTCMYASENAALVRQRNGHQLLVALVGDSLLEPFWPMGTGIARGFLAAMDSAWMVRSWAQGSSALEVLAERESIYRLLPQTTPENVSKNFSQYSVDPTTRYPNISLHLLRPNQVRHLLDAGGSKETLRVDIENVVNASTPKLTRNESIARSSKLLNWCQRQTEGYRGVSVTDLTMSWKSGLALCAIIHRYRPDLIDFDALDERNVERNNQLGFDVSEREFGISPIMTGKEMSAVGEPDKLSMVMYLSQFYEMFKDMVPPGEHHKLSPEEKAALVSKSPISFLSKLGQSIAISRKRNPKDKKEKDVDGLGKRRKTSQAGQSEEEELQRGYHDDRPSIAAVLAERKVDSASAASANHNNKVRSMATQLLAKFEENAPPPSAGLKRQGDSLPNLDLLLLSPSPPPAPAPPPRKEPVRLAPVPAWRQRRTQLQQQMSLRYKERVKGQTLPSRMEQASRSSEGSRSCPKKTILLSPSSLSPSSSSLSLHTQESGSDALELLEPLQLHVQKRTDNHWPQAPQESEVLPLDDQAILHIPSVQERAQHLASRFRDTPATPKKKPSRLFVERWHLSQQGPASRPLPLPSERRQRYVKMYTGGVSLLAEQIANQLRPQEDPRVPAERRDWGSLRKEFPQNIGGSDVCFFCRKRVYVMERLSAEGKFFHRSCFKCDHCGTTLRLSSYAFDVEDGKFYCKPHYCYRVSGQAQRKRPAPTAAAPRTEENQAASAASSTVDSAGRTPAAAAPAERRPSAPELNGTAEPSVAKRLRGTPERIELENYRLSLQREEELEEVPEETLAEHNLSSVLDKATDIGDGSSSSESDMEEEDEEEEQQPGPSDPWKGASEHRVNLNADPGRSAEGGEAVQAGAGARCGLDGEMEEEEDEEDEDEEEEEESSDEGDYYPWQQELQGGLWLHSLADEEDSGTFKAGNLRVQQALQPIDPAGVVVGVSWQGGQENPSASASLQTPPSCSTAPLRTSTKHEAVRAWLDSLSGEPCGEEEDPEAEAGSPNMGPGTELDEDDIPSDAEAEAQLHQGRGGDLLVEENSHSESSDRVSSLVAEPSSDSPKQLIVDVVLSPVLTSEAEPEICTETQRLKSPGDRFFPEPFLLEDTKPLSPSQIVVAPGSVLSPVLKSPLPIASPILLTPSTSIMSPVLFPMPAVSTLASQSPTPIASPVLMTPGVTSSPICSPPFTLPETVSSPVQSQPCACSPSSNPLSPICSQPAPCHEMSSPISSSSPVRTQPVPAVASTPLPKSTADESNASLEETPVKKADIIEEFWLKSAEIRKSLGLTPLDRSRPLEKSSMLTAKVPTPDPSSPKSYTPEDTSEDLKPTFTGRSIIRRLNITVEGQVISPVEPKSNDSERRDLSSSSGLGLNGSIATSQTAASESYNTSDSTMLTPPSSPPPPPPRGEEPATLKHKRYQVAWDKVPVMDDLDDQPKPIPTKAEPKKQTSPPMSTTQAPIPAPRTITVNSSVVMRREAKPRRTEVRKSFAESVEEIPFADDVEDTYDERTAEAGMQSSLYTPPTSKASRDRPPLHLALSMENGKPNIPKPGRSQHFSPEAKEIAEERIRAREKSVKSQALKDAMAKQLRKMESDVPKDTFHKTRESDGLKGAAKVAWSVSETTVKDKKPSGSPKMTAVKSLESKKQPETLPERFFTMAANKSLDSSVTSSESSSGGKSKKRSSLFSPRKNKKEKKAKNENRTSGPEETPPKHKSLWKAVFSGYKKDKKKKEDKSCPSTPSSSTTVDSGKKKTSPLGRSSDLRMRRNISFSEDSDLSCDDVLERSSQKSKADRRVDLFDLVSDLKKDAMKEKEEREKERERLKEKERRKERKKTVQKGNEEESVYVPHALAFKRSYATKKTYTEEELNAKLTRRVQKAARRQAKQEELKRLHRAQIIQRQLEQVEEKQRQLEERGVAVEKALRGEAGLYKGSNVSPKQHKRRSDYWGESHYSEILDLHLGVESSVRSPRRRPLSFCPCCSPAGMGKKDDPKLMQEWFKLVQEKNALVRYESELMIFARELELEDRQSRLQQELRERMAVEDHLKTEKELAEEKQILNEMLEVVEQRDSLVALLEEQRLREKEEDKDLEAVMLSKGFNLNWA